MSGQEGLLYSQESSSSDSPYHNRDLCVNWSVRMHGLHIHIPIDFLLTLHKLDLAVSAVCNACSQVTLDTVSTAVTPGQGGAKLVDTVPMDTLIAGTMHCPSLRFLIMLLHSQTACGPVSHHSNCDSRASIVITCIVAAASFS